MKAMGQEILYPPDVSGWEDGEAWISSATMVERMKWADRLFGARQGGPSVADGLFEKVADQDLPERLASLLDADPPASTKRLMAEAAGKASGTRAKAVAAARLLFASPEFQMR
jgi:uncharacterized protein (DUF1800 family)